MNIKLWLAQMRAKSFLWTPSMLSWRLRRWMFQWKLDDEGDLAIIVFRCIALVKYKEHTVVRFGRFSDWRSAPKYLKEEA